MKRVVRSKSGREIYGPKWQNNNDNMESENENGHSVETTTEIARVSGAAAPPAVTEINVVVEDDEDQAPIGYLQTIELALVPDAAEPSTLTQTNVVADQDQTSQGANRRGLRLSNRHEAMYRAALEGDCMAAEMLLKEDPNLGSDEISEEGDRALHVDASMKHKDFVLKLVEQMSASELEMLDGRGFTACCYVAISGSVEIAELLIGKNRTLATTRDQENRTPLQKAALRGNTKMVSHFLKYVRVKDLSTQEWFDLLLVAIRHRMYVEALKILGSEQQLATMTNDGGTALHLLAREKRFFIRRWESRRGVMGRNMRLLAKKLWRGIQRLGEASRVLELMKNPPILHYAAEVGNVELLTMLTHTYADLVWHTNSQGYTIFHIAVKHRQESLFKLINEIGARKDFIAMSQDENGNNILHLAAELAPPTRKILPMPPFQMHREILWFQKVKEIVPPLCLEMKNKDGHTPQELFHKEHVRLFKESTTWMRNTSDSCMLISTLLFGVVFASTFAVPGGYDQETGIPILLRTNWFTCFVIFEAVAMYWAAFSIIGFWRIMTYSYDESHSLSYRTDPFIAGLVGMLFSVLGVISAFMSAYFLVYIEQRGALVKFVILFVYILLVITVINQTLFFSNFGFPDTLFRMKSKHTLFKRHAAAREKKRRCWIF
ncbi:hypothetical protein C2S51_018463 [Perilla frutescens var. frutescens]|nr:hypothetical protein C2S51_018463 [Perilla frutescens var. frutescens]